MGRCLRRKDLRALLFAKAGGKCSMCGDQLTAGWHADHVIPWSVSGITNVHEMQALCPACNQHKGDRMPASAMKLRLHQAALKKRLHRVEESDLPISILAHVVPGGGKSMLPILVARAFPGLKIAWFVPRLSLARQAAIGAQKQGVSLRETQSEIDPCRGERGFVSTHQALARNPELWRQEFERNPYALVVDESHHAKVDPRTEEPEATARALQMLYPLARLRLDMSGTLETNDSKLILGIDYVDRGGALHVSADSSHDIHIRYPRERALAEGALVPIEFHHHDGEVRYEERGNVFDVVLSEARRRQEAKALYTALRSDIAEQMLRSGFDHWRQSGGGKLIVVSASQRDAEKYARVIGRWGEPVSLAIHDNDAAHDDVKRFSDDVHMGGTRVLVTCQMAYEGLDVPSATHLVCLTHIRSTPWIEQMLGRVWRASEGKTKCHAFVPDDPRMREVIERIRAEEIAATRIRQEEERERGEVGDGEFVMPLGGQLTDIRRSMLDDAGGGESASLESVLRMAEELSGPEQQRLLAWLKTRLDRSPPKLLVTPREEQKKLRQRIAELQKKCDARLARRMDQPPDFGETGRWLCSVTRKRVSEMNTRELRQALQHLERRYANLSA